MTLARHDIVLVPFPFTDGPAAKPRPALVLAMSERHQDVLLAFLSSNISGSVAADELDIPADLPDFAVSGLKVSSRLRITRLTTLSIALIRRRIGVLPHSLRPGLQRLVESTLAADALD
jgi:mRNA interferase MazF